MSSKLPRFPITDILIHFGADELDIPDGGGWQKMKCPFHPDGVASASVNHELGAFTCHGCGVTGDAVKLLQTQLGMDFKDALRRTQELTGVESGPVRRKSRRSSRLLELTRNY